MLIVYTFLSQIAPPVTASSPRPAPPQVLQYTELMSQLDIPTVRELEDFLITECFYNNILKGKLDQKQRALQVGLGGLWAVAGAAAACMLWLCL